jgi:hypothetical protein
MAAGNQQRRGNPQGDHYLDLIDLYAARAFRANTKLAEDAQPLTVIPVGRRQRSTPRAAWRSTQPLRARRIKVASAATAVLIAFSVLAGTALADQPSVVQERDTIPMAGHTFAGEADSPVLTQRFPSDTPVFSGITGIRLDEGFWRIGARDPLPTGDLDAERHVRSPPHPRRGAPAGCRSRL